MNNLKIGASYIVGFPRTAYTSIYKLVAIHNAVCRSDVVTTFIDPAGFKVMFTMGAYANMSVVAAPLPALPATPPFTSQTDSSYETTMTFNDIIDDDPIPSCFPVVRRYTGDFLSDEELYG
jgi:hypothetical protein